MSVSVATAWTAAAVHVVGQTWFLMGALRVHRQADGSSSGFRALPRLYLRSAAASSIAALCISASVLDAALAIGLIAASWIGIWAVARWGVAETPVDQVAGP